VPSRVSVAVSTLPRTQGDCLWTTYTDLMSRDVGAIRVSCATLRPSVRGPKGGPTGKALRTANRGDTTTSGQPSLGDESFLGKGVDVHDGETDQARTIWLPCSSPGKKKTPTSRQAVAGLRSRGISERCGLKTTAVG
jgi:hypothetical protein